MHKRFRGGYASFAPAEVLHQFVVPAIDLFTVLALVGEQSRFLLLPHRGDVDVIGRPVALRLRACIYLIKVESKTSTQCIIGANGQQSGDLVIHVGVEGPLGENEVGRLGCKQFREIGNATRI